MHAFSSDMTSGSNGKLISTLETASSEANTFSQVISLFRSTTVTSLVGPGYDSIRNKMGLYEDGLNIIKTISDNLISNIKAANNAGLNAMQGYGELNTENLGELTNRLNTSKQILQVLYAMLSSGELTDEEASSVASSISSYESIIERLSKLIDILNKLPGRIRGARSMLNGSESDASNLCSKVSNINVSTYC